jgi:hypothetical protein
MGVLGKERRETRVRGYLKSCIGSITYRWQMPVISSRSSFSRIVDGQNTGSVFLDERPERFSLPAPRSLSVRASSARSGGEAGSWSVAEQALKKLICLTKRIPFPSKICLIIRYGGSSTFHSEMLF